MRRITVVVVASTAFVASLAGPPIFNWLRSKPAVVVSAKTAKDVTAVRSADAMTAMLFRPVEMADKDAIAATLTSLEPKRPVPTVSRAQVAAASVPKPKAPVKHARGSLPSELRP